MTTQARKLFLDWSRQLHARTKAHTRRQGFRALVGAITFLGRRVLLGAAVLVFTIFVSYAGLAMARGMGLEEAVLRALSKTPAYLLRLALGDLGRTAAGSLTLRPIPVADVAPLAIARSLGLLATSLAIAALVGTVLGAWAASRRHSSASVGVLLGSIAGVSLPSFLTALLFQLGVIYTTRLTGSRLLPVGGFGWDEHLLLPALVLAARPVAQIFRVTFVRVGEVLDQDYVRTAHSKGLLPGIVMWRHVLRNAAIPVLTTLGLSLRFSLSSLPVVEYFFGWPGVGFNLLKAISRQDDNLTMILVVALGALFISVNVVLEALYRLVDPSLSRQDQREMHADQGGLLATLRSFLAELRDAILHHPLSRRLLRRSPAAIPRLGASQVRIDEAGANERRLTRRRATLRSVFTNLPLLFGGLLVVLLLGVFLLGPRLAPHSPYTTHGLTMQAGRLSVPPFAPGDLYPWGTDALGRDLLSLILAGTQQTLLLAVLVVGGRMILGILLGALAGWLHGTWLDRVVVGISEAVASFPSLLLAMILILALGIRQGLPTFLIALCVIGWGEIMQLVRADVMALRPKPFIESAVAVGARVPRIIQNHVFPNLVPTLISIGALEMGAVLMLLGELGFIGIFIGGGAFAELEIWGAPYHYSDVPEWSALLSNVRTYAQSYPWMGIYPALAFFIAILAFNLFGEGLRRLMESTGMNLARLVNRYVLIAVLVTALGIGWVRENTGSVAFYRRQAMVFSGGNALRHVDALTGPSMQGRSLGTSGLSTAADYVADAFQNAGLQPAGEAFTYFYPRKRAYELLEETPSLSLDDGGPGLVYRADFAEYPDRYRNMGQVGGPVHVLGFGSLTTQRTFGRQSHPALSEYDFSGSVLMLLFESQLDFLLGTDRLGTLVVVEDEAELLRRQTLGDADPRYTRYGTNRQLGRDAPSLWISRATADRILRPIGGDVESLRSQVEDLGPDQLIHEQTGVTAHLSVQGRVHQDVPVRHVIAHLPGTAGSVPGGSGKMDDQLVVVMAQYDCPPPTPGAKDHPCANDNASGVALMLEAARAMLASGYQPYRSFLFVAYAGEGSEAGRSVSVPDASDFLSAKQGFSEAFNLEAIVRIRGVAPVGGGSLEISSGGSGRLAGVFERAADHMGVPIQRSPDPFDISIVFEDLDSYESAQEAPELRLTWEGWQATSRTAQDTLEAVSHEHLRQAGRVLAEALMILGREVNY